MDNTRFMITPNSITARANEIEFGAMVLEFSAMVLGFLACLLFSGDAVLTGGGLKEKLASQRVGASSAEGLQPAVIATEYIEKGDIAGGQNATQVVLPGWTGPTQHSGFFRSRPVRGSLIVASSALQHRAQDVPV